MYRVRSFRVEVEDSLWEGIMQMAEEFIFGQVFRLFFFRQGVRQMARQTVPVKTGQKR